jgi:hypothetical protein
VVGRESGPVQCVAVTLFEEFTVLDVYGPAQAFVSCRVENSAARGDAYSRF